MRHCSTLVRHGFATIGALALVLLVVPAPALADEATPKTAPPAKAGEAAVPGGIRPAQVRDVPVTGVVAPASREGASAPPAPSGPPGKVQIDEKVFDAGSVKRGVRLSHAFEIKNIGTTTVTVEARPG
jgi:hypothetical protein